MKPGVCVCCAELMSDRGGSLSGNPNICASCSSLLDAMDDDRPEWLGPHPKPAPDDPSSAAPSSMAQKDPALQSRGSQD